MWQWLNNLFDQDRDPRITLAGDYGLATPEELMAKPQEPRSAQWEKVRRAFVEAHPYCSNCGGTKDLEAHHEWPFSWPGGKSKELDPHNLIVLCESPGHNCHLMVGHLGDWHSRNPFVVQMAAEMFIAIKNRPYPKS